MARDATKLEATVAKLKKHWADSAPHDMRAAFKSDPGRFERYSLSLDDLLFDWSKCRVNDETIGLLKELAIAADVEGRRAAMFAGEHINNTEDRAVLHVALRDTSSKEVLVDGHNVLPDVKEVLDRMAAFADGIRSGAIKGATGKKITDIVNIGIGGSDLGPVIATLAFSLFPHIMMARVRISSPISTALILRIRLAFSILRRRLSSSLPRRSRPSKQ